MSNIEEIIKPYAEALFIDDKVSTFIIIFGAISLSVLLCKFLFSLLIGYVKRITWPLKKHFKWEVNPYE